MAATQKDEKALEAAKKMDLTLPWCDDYERMISGMLYNGLVPELTKSKLNVRGWCIRYNTWWPDESIDISFDYLQQEREKRLRQVIGKLGSDVYIEPPVHLDYGCNVSIGDRVYSNFNLTILDCALVMIGDRTMFGPNVSILTATHETEVQSRMENIEYARPITIGADCWIGAHVVILPGVTIGEGSTIAAGSIVTKDIPAWSVAMGTPARVVKKVQPITRQGLTNGVMSALERMG